ncbi:MAG: SDR family NAD(P)-dependent oxidoreductase [Gammaproteobacteria bacterium]|nr:SDR family NAD(P)-dependent oxidoreductase [Gammaproteobacteria bacterium]
MAYGTAARRIGLVTGANRGIGFEICRQLAANGVTVLLGARDAAAGGEAAAVLRAEGLEVQAIRIDTADPQSFEAARDFLAHEFGHLDILVNNIGMGFDWGHTAADVPLRLLRETFEINFFSIVDLTQRLLPLIRRSRAGRIVNHSSAIGSLTRRANQAAWNEGDWPLAYSASKTALNSFTMHLACALRKTPIKVNAAHPGIVRTDPNPQGLIGPAEGARTAVALALLPEEGPTGGFFHLGESIPL